jgi:hypothetical protein
MEMSHFDNRTLQQMILFQEIIISVIAKATWCLELKNIYFLLQQLMSCTDSLENDSCAVLTNSEHSN